MATKRTNSNSSDSVNESSSVNAVDTYYDEIRISDVLSILLGGWRSVLYSIVIFVTVAVLYAVLARPLYKSEVLLVEVSDTQSGAMSSGVGGLAALAGISLGDGQSQEAIATFRSRDFAREFILAKGIQLQMRSSPWRFSESGDDDVATVDMRDAVDFFRKNVLSVTRDAESGLISAEVTWREPNTAAQWAEDLVRLVNDRLRKRAMDRSKRNIEFLSQQLEETKLLALEQSIGAVLKSELQKMMLAEGSSEFAFRTIDGATPPTEPVWPRPVKLLALSIMAGFFGGALLVFARHASKSS